MSVGRYHVAKEDLTLNDIGGRTAALNSEAYDLEAPSPGFIQDADNL